MHLSYDHIRNNSTIYQRQDNDYPLILIYDIWRVFYSNKGDTSPYNVIDSNDSGIPDYIELMLYKFQTAKILLEQSFGLSDPLSKGHFHEKGTKYIDICIKNIPREHGIASGIVYDDKIDILENNQHQGKSIKIWIHRNLINRSATPIHELFHIFQYSYAHFNNMWFMEGLARWSQSIMQAKIGDCETLPQNKKELEILVNKLHDSEFFWNQLINLSEEKDTFSISADLKNNNEIYNNKKKGSSFIPLFLENCQEQCDLLEHKLKIRNNKNLNYWQRSEKRSANNNQYILKAIIDTIESLKIKKNRELSNFLDTIYPFSKTSPYNYNSSEIQKLLRVLSKYTPELVSRNKHGILFSIYFDILTGTLSFDNISLECIEIVDDELDTFKIIKIINGSLTIDNCKNLTDLNGLRNISSINGRLTLSRLNLEKISDFNNLLHLENLEISKMSKLLSINGINELISIKNTLRINNNLKLESINGFNSLLAIKNIEIIDTNLNSCLFLRKIFLKNNIFEGYIKICANKLEDVKFMKGVKTIKSSLYLHQNQLQNLEGLESLEHVGASLSVSGNRLTTLKQLGRLKIINGIFASSYNNLTSLDGLENVTNLMTKKWGNMYFTLKIYGNPLLKDIKGLCNIQTKENYVVIYFDNEIRYSKKPDSDSLFHRNILELHDFKTNELVPTYTFTKKEEHNYKNFKTATHNKLFNSLFDFESADAKILVLSFTGAYGNLGGLFYNKFPLITEGINTHKIFIMDPSHAWYNSGIKPFTRDMDENIHFIRKIIETKKYNKVVCMGASMGAYFSLILGCCLKDLVNEVLTFSPQIFLDKANRAKHGDTRWEKLIQHFPKKMKKEYWDLNLLFNKHKNTTTQFNIHYALNDALDKAHIEHLPRQNNINLIAYNTDSHYITRMLHKQNALNDIILNSLTP